mgnify:CR=1 FL=1
MALTPKQEAFCLAYVETGNASEAYRRSYNAEKMKAETVNRTAKELLDNPKIAARVKELQESHQRRHNVTVDSLLAELEEARLMALQEAQPSAAISATMGKAKIVGVDVQKVEHSGGVSMSHKIEFIGDD